VVEWVWGKGGALSGRVETVVLLGGQLTLGLGGAGEAGEWTGDLKVVD